MTPHQINLSIGMTQMSIYRTLIYLVVGLTCAHTSTAKAGTILRLDVNGEETIISEDREFQYQFSSRLVRDLSFRRRTSDSVNSTVVDANSTNGTDEKWHIRFAAGSDIREGYFELVNGIYTAESHPLCTSSLPPICPATLDIRHNDVPLLSVLAKPGQFVSAKGQFEILEAVFGEDGEVLSFAADFQQFDALGQVALTGQIRHNSAIPIPEPGTVVLAAIGCLGLAVMRRQRRGAGR